jgi:hypothetical protein
MGIHQSDQATFRSVLPKGVDRKSGAPHFRWAKSGTYETQVTENGPLGLGYIDQADNPRIQ